MAFYGLPAAGIVSLALLNLSVVSSFTELQAAEMLQNLAVLVTEIRVGAVLGPGDPNFELFKRAAQTIQNLLDTMLPASFQTRRAIAQLDKQQTTLEDRDQDQNRDVEWTPWINADPWEFELDFWNNLAEHPLLLGTDAGS